MAYLYYAELVENRGTFWLTILISDLEYADDMALVAKSLAGLTPLL